MQHARTSLQYTGWDSTLLMQRPRVRSLVGKLRYHMPCSMAKLKKKKIQYPVYPKISPDWIAWNYSVSVHFSSVAQSCPTLYNPMNRSTPGLPVHHQLPESIQTHVHQVGDAIQPSHPLLSPSPPAHTPSQHQGLFQ